MPTRRGLLGLAGAVLISRAAGAALPPEDAEVVGRVEAYFNRLLTLQARFSQINPDGSLATGTVSIDRDRSGMRFDYDPPSQILLIAPGDWRLIFYDGSIKQVNVIPLRQTPLGFLFEERVRLAEDVTVTEVARRPGEVDLTLVRSEAPDQGNVVLTLADRPMALRSWLVTDPQGLRTRIILEDVKSGVELDRQLFVWRDPKMFGWPEE